MREWGEGWGGGGGGYGRDNVRKSLHHVVWVCFGLLFCWVCCCCCLGGVTVLSFVSMLI